MDSDAKEERPPNPRAGANLFKILTFSWTFNIFKTGRKRVLEVNDLYRPLSDYKSSLLGNELEKRWKSEMADAKNINREPSLLRVLTKMFGAKIFFCGLIQIFVEIIIRMSQPLLIGGLISHFNSNESSTTNIRHAYFYAFGLLLTVFINMLLFHYSHNELVYCGMQIRVACGSVIFKKALRLSKSSIGETNVGQIVNLLSNDVNRFDMVISYMNYLWIGPLGTIVATYFLWQEIGVSSLFGILVLIMFIPLQGWLGKKTSEFRLKIAPKTDDRVKLMNEIISGIKVIKMYTWEKPFAYLVEKLRKLEIDEIRSVTHIKVTLLSFIIFHTRFAIFTSILSYVLLGNYITTQKVFIIIAYFNILLTTMTVFFPQAIGMVAEVRISIQRIQEFLLNNEKYQKEPLSIEAENTNCEKSSIDNHELDVIDNTDDQNQINHSEHFAINISNASAKWISSQQDKTLNNINLAVRPGQLVAVIGSVGAGKSSLIQAILRELELSEGKISVNGVVSYASQEPWLFNNSVQQNILFDSPMNKERYEQVIHVCALKTDLKMFPYGDRTIVGEKGVSLSGGQRARINLARAIYKQADIYLLDDPLSAVDTHVGNHIFQKCIKDFLREKTCIIITHQKQYLSNVDRIAIMNNANIVADGNYHELQSTGSDFNRLLISSDNPSVESDNEFCIVVDESKDSSDVPNIITRQDSISSSIGESKINTTQAEPIEESETYSTGNVSQSVYYTYIFAGENMYKLSILLFTTVFTYIVSTGGDYWISFWVNQEDRIFNNIKSVSTHNITLMNRESTIILPWWSISRETCVTIYVVLNLIMIVIVFIRNFSFVSVFMGISKNLHNNMFNAITRTTMQFFNSNPSGRILNRFTKDMGAIDEILPTPVLFCIHVSLTIIGTIFIIGIVNVCLLIPTFIAGFICYWTIVFFLPTCRCIKRLEGITRSFVFAHFNSSFQGLATIRAFKVEEILSDEFDRHQDLHSSALHLYIYSNAAFGFTLDIICFTYISILLFGILVLYNDTSNGYVGLIITQTINITGQLQWGVRQLGELENQMTSVERVLEYTNVPKEGALESSAEKKPPNEWPDKGLIVFQNVYLRYNQNSPYVLKNVNIKIQPMEKVGVVGRTGAGKSSLIDALFRLAFNEGNIFIDGIDIHELGLHDLRSKLSIIPQDPVLFSGTIRTNLDPFDKYPDHNLWNALDEVELKKTIENLNGGLNSKMSEGGSNFSVGQRQLVCLARALVQNNKFLMLDEATANVDSHTDSLIQKTIRNKFQACTVLTVAHRLDTVMDSDKILVMDAGTMVEFDHPHNLLKNKDGYLYKMVQQTGRATADSLHSIATESYEKRNKTTEFSTKITANCANDSNDSS